MKFRTQRWISLLHLGLLLSCSSCTATAQREHQPALDDRETDPALSESQASDLRDEPAPEPETAEPRSPDAVVAEAMAEAMANASPRPPASPTDEGARLRWSIEVEPTPMRMDQRGDCRIRISVTNEGEEAARPNISNGQFFLDEQPSLGLGMAFSNGAMERRWTSLPPGETVSTERSMCESLFQTPGEYTIDYRRNDRTLNATVRVVP